MSDQRLGIWYAVGAYGLWGLLPLYLVALRPAGPVEILAHRVVWSFLLLVVVLAIARRRHWLRTAGPRAVGGLAVAGVLIGANWGIYIYGATTGRVVEVALGYFINPLVSVLLGVLFLGERLRPWQWAAIGVGAAAVAVLAWDYGRPPGLALILACCFGGYGLIKKLVGAPAVEGMTVETATLLVPATGYLVWSEFAGRAAFGHVPWLTTLLLVGTGVITAVPLLLFAGAANRVSMTVLGITQYLAPTLQLLIGVLLFHEPMPPARLAGFVLVWAALAIFTFDAVRRGPSAVDRIGEPGRLPSVASPPNQHRPAPRSASSASSPSASS